MISVVGDEGVDENLKQFHSHNTANGSEYTTESTLRIGHAMC